MKLKFNTAIVFLLALVLLSTGGLGLRTYSGDSVLIETPVDDDIFAAGQPAGWACALIRGIPSLSKRR